MQELDQPIPMIESIADCLGQCGAAGDAFELLAQPVMHGLDKRSATLLTYQLALFG